MRIRHNLPDVLEVGKEYKLKLEKVEEEPECPIPSDKLFVQTKGKPKVYFMQNSVARWVTTSQILHDLATDLELDENQRTWVEAKCLDPSNPGAIPIGERVEKWPEAEEYKITQRGFMISGGGAPSISELKNVGINLVFDREARPISNMKVFEWRNFINMVRPSNSRGQVLSNGGDAGNCVCPNQFELIEKMARDKLDASKSVDGFVGDGFRYAEKKRDGTWYRGGFCDVCRRDGDYDLGESDKAIEFKCQVIDRVAKICQDIFNEAGKTFGAFVGFDWSEVGQGHRDKLGKNLGLVYVMNYAKDEKFRGLCQGWREEVPNDKLIIVLTWDSDGGSINQLTEKVRWCEQNSFNWCMTGNRYKNEQLQAIKKALNK